jgi:hypothetical protein
MEYIEGEIVRLKSSSQGWILAKVIKYSEVIEGVNGVVYDGSHYIVRVLEGKHTNEKLRIPVNYIERLPENCSIGQLEKTDEYREQPQGRLYKVWFKDGSYVEVSGNFGEILLDNPEAVKVEEA